LDIAKFSDNLITIDCKTTLANRYIIFMIMIQLIN